MIKNVYVEEPIFLEDLKVRGFADLIIELDKTTGILKRKNINRLF